MHPLPPLAAMTLYVALALLAALTAPAGSTGARARVVQLEAPPARLIALATSTSSSPRVQP